MSLLMEALKQQQGVADRAPVPAQQGFWRPLALAALVLLGVGIGFGVTYWLTPAGPTVPAAAAQTGAVNEAGTTATIAATTASAPLPNTTAGAAVATVAAASALPPAHPGLILSDLLAMPAGSEPTQLVVSAQRGGVQTVDSEPEQEQFNELPPMAEADTAEPAVIESMPELQAEEVPEALRQKFQFAVEATGDKAPRPKVTEHAAPARDIRSLDEMLQRQIPPLRFEAHVYASDPAQRWVKVNGKDLQEGQWVTADIQIKEITANYVMMQTGRQLFSMEALTDWSYRLPSQR